MTETIVNRSATLTPAGAALFTLTWLVLGAVSPGYPLFGRTIAPYSWVSQPISGLGLGSTGPWMNAAFVLGGVLVSAGVLATARLWRGRSRRTALVLLACMGVGMAVCGLFTLESIMLHLVGFVVAVVLPGVGLVLAGVALRRTAPRLATVALVGGVATLALFVAFQATFDPAAAGDGGGVAGLVQRVLVVVAMATVSVVVVGVARGGARGAVAGASAGRLLTR
jgi:hypothetical membrane protein